MLIVGTDGILALVFALDVDGMRGYGMCQKHGRDIRSTIFLKMSRLRREVGHYFSHLSNVNYFFKVHVVTKSITCSR